MSSKSPVPGVDFAPSRLRCAFLFLKILKSGGGSIFCFCRIKKSSGGKGRCSGYRCLGRGSRMVENRRAPRGDGKTQLIERKGERHPHRLVELLAFALMH